MADNKSWIKLGSIRKGKTGNSYIALGSPKDKQPTTVELVVKDASGAVLATVVNPMLQVQNPRKRPGATEEQIAKVPEWLVADISLPPAKAS
jgi:hypothetical protein